MGPFGVVVGDPLSDQLAGVSSATPPRIDFNLDWDIALQSAIGSKAHLQVSKDCHQLKPLLFRKYPHRLLGCGN